MRDWTLQCVTNLPKDPQEVHLPGLFRQTQPCVLRLEASGWVFRPSRCSCAWAQRQTRRRGMGTGPLRSARARGTGRRWKWLGGRIHAQIYRKRNHIGGGSAYLPGTPNLQVVLVHPTYTHSNLHYYRAIEVFPGMKRGLQFHTHALYNMFGFT